MRCIINFSLSLNLFSSLRLIIDNKVTCRYVFFTSHWISLIIIVYSRFWILWIWPLVKFMINHICWNSHFIIFSIEDFIRLLDLSIRTWTLRLGSRRLLLAFKILLKGGYFLLLSWLTRLNFIYWALWFLSSYYRLKSRLSGVGRTS